MSRTFAAVVQRTELWDPAKPPQEQSGFAAHAAYMGSLEEEGFIALAGLMLDSTDVLFVLRADSKEAVRQRFSQDPWQQDGHTRLVRLEEIAIRTGAPAPIGG